MQKYKRPDGCHYYAESEDGRFRFIAHAPPPDLGDRLCLGTVGKTESQLVQAILDGKFNHIFERTGKGPTHEIL